MKVETAILLELEWLLAFDEEFDRREIANETYVECDNIWHKKLKRILAL